MKKKGGPIKDSPVHEYKWPDMGRKSGGDVGKGPIVNDPVKNFKWPNMGRKNG